MRISATFALFLLLTVAAASQSPAAPAQPATEGPSPADSLLRRVKGTLTLFPPAERATLLIHLAKASPGNQASEAEEWTEEIFLLTNQMRSGVERMNDEATALITLSRVDSERALELLPRIELPSSPGNAYEFREKAASQVFRKFIDDHPRDIEKVMAIARRMGELGTYPFRAAGAVVLHIGKHDQTHTAEMISDAAYYYHHAPRTHFFNLEFAEFMKDSARFAPHSISRDDLQMLVANVMNSHLDDRAVWGNAFTASGKPVSPRAAVETFLAGLLPAIHAVDPEWEARLKQEYPALESEKFRKAQKARMLDATWGMADPEEWANDHAAPRPALNEIHNLTAEDAQKALKIRDAIRDPAWRAAAGADIAVMLDPVDPKRADRLLADAERQLKHTADPQNKLRINAALGRAYLRLGRREAFANVIARMFQPADEIFSRFSREAPKCAWATLPGARELVPLTRAAAAFAPQLMLEKIDSVQTPLLQTHLLISMLEGLQDAELK